jgi:hypothetical protein
MKAIYVGGLNSFLFSINWVIVKRTYTRAAFLDPFCSSFKVRNAILCTLIVNIL